MELQFFYSLSYCIFEVNTKIDGGDEHQTAALLILLLTSEVMIDQLETESSDKTTQQYNFSIHFSSPTQTFSSLLLSNFTVRKFI